MSDSGWNPFREYDTHTFGGHFSSMIYVFSGRVFDPTKTKWHVTDVFTSKPMVTHPGTNHWGIYDYVTLGIIRLIEDFCLANWCASTSWNYPIKILGAPIWIPLALVRYGIGLLGAVLSVPFIAVAYGYQCHMDSIKEISKHSNALQSNHNESGKFQVPHYKVHKVFSKQGSDFLITINEANALMNEHNNPTAETTPEPANCKYHFFFIAQQNYNQTPEWNLTQVPQPT